jgi:hypothetical protein
VGSFKIIRLRNRGASSSVRSLFFFAGSFSCLPGKCSQSYLLLTDDEEIGDGGGASEGCGKQRDCENCSARPSSVGGRFVSLK